ncbi:glycosyltransferase [Peribacillus asahii]|uniref:Glycosyltransferase n=1 Tax=Peribacillus asahii TaxID=228899 RepID=A0A398B3Y2_9BACI|nr:glycosyltransferase [Peribacillus asahii]RID84739.1 glycosyltransferase [Peribacillus asahii]
MKILQVNILYNQGSTGKITADIHKVLEEDGIQSLVCYGAGQKVNDSNIYMVASHYELSFYRIWAHFMGLQYGSGYMSTLRLIKYIKKEKPDVVHLHCINGFFVNIYKLLEFLKKEDINTVLTLHAEFMYTGNCGHAFECEKWKTGCGACPQLWDATYSYYFDRTATAWRKMYKAFKDFNNLVITCVSPWLHERAQLAPILMGKKMVTIENGIDTKNIFHPVPFNDLKKELGIEEQKIILHVTANFTTREDDLKGGRYIYQLAENLKDENVKIVVIGSNDTTVKVPPNMLNIGRVNDQNILAKYYSMADLTIITSKRETFSMPSAESLACGTPVIGFKAGGPETICLKEYSEFVEYGDIEALTNCTLKWINFKNRQGEEISNRAYVHYSKEKMVEGYLDVYKKMIK